MSDSSECKWIVDDDDNECNYTQCGEIFVSLAGSIKDNGIKYCPFCGGKIKDKT